MISLESFNSLLAYVPTYYLLNKVIYVRAVPHVRYSARPADPRYQYGRSQSNRARRSSKSLDSLVEYIYYHHVPVNGLGTSIMAFTKLTAVVLGAFVGHAATQSVTPDTKYDVLQYVNQLIGSSNGGGNCKRPQENPANWAQEMYFRVLRYLMVSHLRCISESRSPNERDGQSCSGHKFRF
jgi:hypothetical protein